VKRIAPITLGLALLASACSSSSNGSAAGTTTVVPSTSTSSTSTTVLPTTTLPEATTTTVAAPTSTAAPTTTVAPPPAPPVTPKPPSTPAPTAPKGPTLSSVKLSAPLPSCNPGDVLTLTITFRAANAAGVTVWSSYDGDLGQYPAEYGSVDVPYTCVSGQTLFTLHPVAEGGALGAAVDLYV